VFYFPGNYTEFKGADNPKSIIQENKSYNKKGDFYAK